MKLFVDCQSPGKAKEVAEEALDDKGWWERSQDKQGPY